MNIVYLLRHTYEYGNELEHESTKELGVYTSLDKAVEAQKRYKQYEGFADYSEDCFYICEYELDKDAEWVGGFISWKDIYDHQKKNGICQGNEFKKSIYDENY